MTTTILFANNAISTLVAGIGSGALTCTLQPGAGALFPSPTGGQFFTLTFNDAATNKLFEICHCTGRSGDVLTIARAQEGTTALAWLAGDIAANWNTAQTMRSFPQTSIYADTFSANETPSPAPPQIGPLNFYNTAQSGTQTLTLDATLLTGGSTTLTLFGNTTQLLASNGVQVNLGAQDVQPLYYAPLLSSYYHQGPWGGAGTTFGRPSILGNLTGAAADNFYYAGTLVLSSSLVIYAVTTSGTISFIAYNPLTKLYGAPSASLAGTHLAGLFALSATSFIGISDTHAVAGSVSALAIATGTSRSTTLIGGLLSMAAPLSATSFLCVGCFDAGPHVGAVAMSVSGTNITMGTAVTGPTVDTGTSVCVAVGSATSAVATWSDTNATGQLSAAVLTISGITISPWGSALNLVSTITPGSAVLINRTATTYFVAYGYFGGGGVLGAVLTVSGTSVSSGSTTPVADPIDNSAVADFHVSRYAYPNALPHVVSKLRVAQYAASTYLVMSTGTAAVTVSGTTVTAGSITSNSAAVENIDATWALATTAGVVSSLTVTGTTLNLTPLSGASVVSGKLSGCSATMLGGGTIADGSGNWFPYNTPNAYRAPVGLNGDGLLFASPTITNTTYAIVDSVT